MKLQQFLRQNNQKVTHFYIGMSLVLYDNHELILL